MANDEHQHGKRDDKQHGKQDGGSDPQSFIDSLAERTEGIAAAAGFGVDMRAIIDTWGTILSDASTQPKAVLDAARGFGSALSAIWLGENKPTAAPVDPRFGDAAWQDNPLFRRIGQSYLAWTNSLDDWLNRSGLEGIDRERARFVLDAAKDVLAPVNTLVGNPEALRRAVETRGASVVKGMRNFVDDIRFNHGYPAVADRHAFQIGKRSEEHNV